MSLLKSFQPKYGSGITGTATTSSAQATIDGATKTSGGGSKSVAVTNLDATNVLYFRIGTGTLVASSADYPVPPGGQVCVSKAETDDAIAVLAAASTVAYHAIPGEGF